MFNIFKSKRKRYYELEMGLAKELLSLTTEVVALKNRQLQKEQDELEEYKRLKEKFEVKKHKK